MLTYILSMKDLIYFIILILNVGCNYIPCSSSSDLDYVKQLSNPSLIAGIYTPDEFTKQDFKEYSASDSTFLEIETNGKISLHNFPESTFGSWRETDIVTVDGSGTWTSSFKSGTTKLTTKITFKQTNVMHPSDFRLFKKGNKFYILIDFGDPDNCTSIRLKQQ